MTTLTKHHLKKIRESLPFRYAEGIRKRINNNDISDSLISAVMNGEKPDYHGIIKAAIQWSKEIKEEKEEAVKYSEEINSNK